MALTVMATGEDDVQSSSSATVSSESSSDVSSETSSEETSSNESTSSDETYSEETSSEEGTSSEEDTSSEESSSEEGTSSDESSSDEATSSTTSTTSKPGQSSAKPGGGSTFIDETGSNVTGSIPTVDVEEGDEEQLYSPDEEAEGVDEEIEEYEGGKVVAMSSLVYRYIWIPILISLLCIGGLIYVNVFVRIKLASGTNSHTPNTTHKATRKGAKRRNVK